MARISNAARLEYLRKNEKQLATQAAQAAERVRASGIPVRILSVGLGVLLLAWCEGCAPRTMRVRAHHIDLFIDAFEAGNVDSVRLEG